VGKEGYSRILWLDLETTGSGDNAAVIEMGAVLTDLDYNVLGTFQRVYSTLVTKYDKEQIAPVVWKMHKGNGLWDEVAIADLAFHNPDAEEEFLKWLGPDKSHILLAGSGVAHFDRRYIKRDWPKVDKRLTYYALDIGVVRRFLKLAGVEFPQIKDNNHRALSDTFACIEEAKVYKNFITEKVNT